MNDKFFLLPEKKRKAIMDAGYQIFYRYGYRKASMSETAAEAGISKALLFHYFRNKKEYYLYLFQYAMQLTIQISKDEISISETDFFQIFLQSARVKSRLLKNHMYLSCFMMAAYYENDEEVSSELKKMTAVASSVSIEQVLNRIDKSKFKEDIDVEQLIRNVIWCGEGYMKEKYYNDQLDIEEVEAGYRELLLFFRRLCYREES